MPADRQSQISELFHAALARDPARRDGFIDEACRGDQTLKEEVRRLISAHATVDSFLESPVVALAPIRRLEPGTSLGPYSVTGFIGAGGMGEVYRARDTQLDRDVAIKVLPAAFVSDPERLARFRREAKTLAALNHPHIAAIYGFESDGTAALILELVEGATLADRIAQGAIPVDEALPIAKQIAEALEAAHEQGIVHRDLKPANVKVRPDGTVKVLDFGLAKALDTGLAAPDAAESPTITSPAKMTGVGVLLGTAAYMSPEQAGGRAVDRRADIWAFGAVLYELLTGARAFKGESVAETLAHVLTQAPNWALMPAGTPAPIRRLLRRCLEKNPTKRLDSAVALRLEIDDVLAAPAGVTPVDDPQARRRRITWGAAITAVVAASVIAALGTWAVILMRYESQAPALPVRFTITPPLTEPMAFTNHGRDIALSPDGRYLAYESRGRLMLRALDQLDVVLLSSVASGQTPFFSPDSKWIGFFDAGDLKKVEVTGGSVLTLCRELGIPNGGAWGNDGTIVVSSRDSNIGLRTCSADGGEATVLTETDAAHQAYRSPSMLPGGRGVLFTMGPSTPEGRQVAVLDLKSGQQKTLVRGGAAAEYLDTGHLVYATVTTTVGPQGSSPQQSGTLWVVGFDLDRLEVRGEPFRVRETIQIDVSTAVNYAVSRTGALVYVPARLEARSFVWVDRTTKRETAIDGLPPRPYGAIGLSRDGTRVAYQILGVRGIYAWDFAQRHETQLTPDWGGVPQWTSDGRVVFHSDRAGPQNLYAVASDGSGSIERLTTSTQAQFMNSITPDGFVLFCEMRPKTGYDIIRVRLPAPQGAGRPAERPSEPTPLLSTSAAEYAPSVSPDLRYFAYRSNESGEGDEIYVRPYLDATRGQWKISTEGGMAPMWSQSGTEIFYLDPSNTMMAVSVDTSGPQFSAGRPAKVFDTKYSGNFFSYDVTKDGRFLMKKDSSSPASMVVVLNWFEELRRRVPTR